MYVFTATVQILGETHSTRKVLYSGLGGGGVAIWMLPSVMLTNVG